jgi:hypothetical protein
MKHGLAGTCVFSWTDEWWVGGKKVEGWNFGLTREDRAPKEALGAVAEHYEGGLLASRTDWPKASVVVCAYQAESTIEECLQSLAKLNHPDYEILVVDDGSTDATAELASSYPVRVISGAVWDSRGPETSGSSRPQEISSRTSTPTPGPTRTGLPTWWWASILRMRPASAGRTYLPPRTRRWPGV